MQLTKLITVVISTMMLSCSQVKYPYGERVFNRLCGDCHMEDGSGVSSLYPSLSNNTIVDHYQDIPCIIRHGVDDTTSVIQMMAMPEVSDVDITNIVNYIIHDLNESDTEVFLSEVKSILKDCVLRPTN